jgi:hypothetical protein
VLSAKAGQRNDTIHAFSKQQSSISLHLSLQHYLNTPQDNYHHTKTAIMGFHVAHQMHQYTLIPRVLYVRRYGLKRWSLAFGRKGRIQYT